MDSLPDDIFLRIMRFNTHPCADIMNDLYKPYHDAMEIQLKSKCPHFRAMETPSFLDWKLRGIGCKQWTILFQAREDAIRRTCMLDRLGCPWFDRRINRWNDERAQLQGLEYKF
jgi:hypothetical protein